MGNFSRLCKLHSLKLLVIDHYVGSEDDGGEKPEGDPAAADCGQNHEVCGQERGWQDQL